MTAMPKGLDHLSANLFAETPTVSDDARGVALIAASGAVGEARLVARQLRTWLDAGVMPSDITVVLRDLPMQEALLREVFEEYAVPAVWPAPPSLGACGAIATVRQAWRLPTRSFRFRDLAALWRNSYFRPQFEADLPLRAESLLRQLGVPHGTAAYLDALQTTAEARLPLPLEDESMQSGERAALSQAAKRCLGFIQWFFGLYDAYPIAAPPKAIVAQLRALAEAMNLGAAPLPGDDAAAWLEFWTLLEERAATTPRLSVTLAEFERVLDDVSQSPWPLPASDGVRVLPADTATGDCTHLIFMGLGEGTFPRFSNEATEAALAAERALFATLVRRPTTALVFSYAALDDKGQRLLPATFLTEALAHLRGVATTTQTMLLDGYLTAPPLSPAEIRTQAAAAGAVSANLAAAKRMADARFRSGSAAYSGGLAHPPVLDAIAEAFGPERVFSPTALETYIACPCKFWMEKVLRLQPLDEPSEEVEVSRRGSAIHRALARFHENAPQARPDQIAEELHANWQRAVGEHVERTPSAAGRVLWSLECRRVARSLNHYPGQWSGFQSGWRKRGPDPTPYRFEAMFGYDSKLESKPALVLKEDNVEVRLGGIIDRIDVATLDTGLGFWIIDYKTGRGSHFSGRDLLNFERLQLPLYALALERVFDFDGPVRPLGMAYWIILEDGPRHMLPGKRDEFMWLEDTEAWPRYRARLERVVACVARHLRRGDFRVAPRHKHTCNWCDFKTICRINQQRGRSIPLRLIED